jgi:hypothetical protein
MATTTTRSTIELINNDFGPVAFSNQTLFMVRFMARVLLNIQNTSRTSKIMQLLPRQALFSFDKSRKIGRAWPRVAA